MNHLLVRYVGSRRGEIYINTFSNIEEYKIRYNNIEYKILKFNMSDKKWNKYLKKINKVIIVRIVLLK